MKRYFIYILVLACLFSNVTFAWDADPKTMLGHNGTSIDLLSGELSHGDSHHPEGDLHHYDHCCHGIAHLVGLIDKSSLRFTGGNSGKIHSLNYPIISHFLPLLLRPPIV